MMAVTPRSGSAALSDAQLISAIAHGDMDALGLLYDRHEPEVRRFLGRMGVSAHDADDLVQGVFLEVPAIASRFDAAMPARAWLLGIAAMLVRRHRRSIARAVARLVAWASLSHADSAPSPAEQAEYDSAALRFQEAFHRLSPEHREVFTLVTLEGLKGEDVARALAIPVNTVWTRLHHARKHLRAHVEEGRQP